MIQMNVFAGQEQKHGCRKWACGHGLGGKGSGINWKIEIDRYIPP